MVLGPKHWFELDGRLTIYARVADPDWIRIQSGKWIRIRNPDAVPGGQK